MNREEFLTKIFEMFSASFNNNNKQTWWDAYKKALSIKLDYDALFDAVLSEYEQKTAPSPAWLKARAKIKKEFKENQADIEYPSIVATSKKTGYEFIFGLEPNQTFEQVKKALEKKGYTNIHLKEDEYGKQDVLF